MRCFEHNAQLMYHAGHPQAESGPDCILAWNKDHVFGVIGTTGARVVTSIESWKPRVGMLVVEMIAKIRRAYLLMVARSRRFVENLACHGRWFARSSVLKRISVRARAAASASAEDGLLKCRA